jgi:hypothetical protein
MGPRIPWVGILGNHSKMISGRNQKLMANAMDNMENSEAQ